MAEKRSNRERAGVAAAVTVGVLAGMVAGVTVERGHDSHEAAVARNVEKQQGLALVDASTSLDNIKTAKHSADSLPDSSIAQKVRAALEAKEAAVVASTGQELRTTPGSEALNAGLIALAAENVTDITDPAVRETARLALFTDEAHQAGDSTNPQPDPAVVEGLLHQIATQTQDRETPSQSLITQSTEAAHGDQTAKTDLDIQWQDQQQTLSGYEQATRNTLLPNQT